MAFETIIGQTLAVQLVQRWLAKETNQPLLFYGPEGSGKRSLALETAKALNCKETKAVIPANAGPPHFRRTGSPVVWRPGIQEWSNLDPGLRRGDESFSACGRCPSCKKISSGNHPDVRIIDRNYQAIVRGEALEKQLTLKIETILEERKRLYQTPTEGPWKVSILDEAHKMTPDAANVLLKVMEEPPARTAIFMLTPYRDRILSTLFSRCQPVRFRSLSDEERLKRLNAEEKENLKEAEDLWKRLPDLTPQDILAQPATRSRATAAANRIEVEAQLVSLLIPASRDLRQGTPRAAQRIELIHKAQQQLRQNVPPSLVYDQLLLELRKPA